MAAPAVAIDPCLRGTAARHRSDQEGTMVSRAVTYVRHNALAVVAVFFSLGGASYAAVQIPANSVGTSQLKARAVTLAKISPAALATLRTQGAPGPAGAQGPKGDPGPQGPPGAPGNPATYPAVLPSGQTETGAYAIRFDASGANVSEDAAVSFPLPLATALSSAGCGGTCTGSFQHP